MKKQTAVEWLFDQLCSNKFSWVNYSDKIYIDKITSDIYNQAKIMEKEQIKDAYWEGGQDVPVNPKQCEIYYNETYNK